MTDSGLELARMRAPTGTAEAASARPLRILHVVSGLDRGGIEIWLLEVLRRIDQSRYQMDFLVVADEPGTQAHEYERLGSQVIMCPTPKQPWRVARDLNAAFARFGPYDVVHAHIHHYDGFILRWAAQRGVPIRIAHSHNDTRPAEAGASWRRRLYLGLMKRWIKRYATQRLAVSRSAAEDLFGGAPPDVPDVTLLPCGLDFTAFAVNRDRAAIRAELDLPEDALVVGHVGRFHWRKNHDWLLLVAAELCRREPRTRLLLVGDGERTDEIRARAAAIGIADRVQFAGGRDDVATLMQIMDVFVFPSHHEGLGLVLLEAQATALPCVLTDSLPEEVDVIPSLMHRLPLKAPATVWADCVLDASTGPRPSRPEAFQAIVSSIYDITVSLRDLQRVYSS